MKNKYRPALYVLDVVQPHNMNAIIAPGHRQIEWLDCSVCVCVLFVACTRALGRMGLFTCGHKYAMCCALAVKLPVPHRTATPYRLHVCTVILFGSTHLLIT